MGEESAAPAEWDKRCGSRTGAYSIIQNILLWHVTRTVLSNITHQILLQEGTLSIGENGGKAMNYEAIQVDFVIE